MVFPQIIIKKAIKRFNIITEYKFLPGCCNKMSNSSFATTIRNRSLLSKTNMTAWALLEKIKKHLINYCMVAIVLPQQILTMYSWSGSPGVNSKYIESDHYKLPEWNLGDTNFFLIFDGQNPKV